MKSKIIVVFFVFGFYPLAAHASPVEHYYFSKSKDKHVADWSYSGPTGPEFWAALDPSFKLACKGKRQSPINIDSNLKRGTELSALKFDYRPEKMGAINNGHTIEHEGNHGSFLRIGNESFSLEQFHVHAPSEHTLDGKSFPIEIHFVHKSRAGKVVVVGIFVQNDPTSKVAFPYYLDLPKTGGEGASAEGVRDLSDFLPKQREYFSYSGSFTTPPCTEDVRWIVMKYAIGIQPKVVERFAAILKGNNRPVQKLNDRVVEVSPKY